MLKEKLWPSKLFYGGDMFSERVFLVKEVELDKVSD